MTFTTTSTDAFSTLLQDATEGSYYTLNLDLVGARLASEEDATRLEAIEAGEFRREEADQNVITYYINDEYDELIAINYVRRSTESFEYVMPLPRSLS